MSFTPVIRNSKSIPRSLLEFSRDRDIDTKFLDFELLSHETFIKKPNMQEYTLVEDINDITQADLLNPEMHIIQEYRIEIKTLKPSRSLIKLSLGADKFKTKASLTIKKESVFKKDLDTLQALKRKIWKKKLRAGLFIEIFEENLEKKLHKLLKSIPYDKPLGKDIAFTVAHAVTPSVPIHAKLEKIYEEKKQETDNAFSGIIAGELIAKYTFMKNGTPGRSCDGKFIVPRETKVKEVEPQIDDTITAKRTSDSIRYFANINGYVLFFKGNLSISKNLKLQGASFKTTSNINAEDADNDISVHIEHNKCHSEDAIGSGVNIDVKDLNVDGSIASNVNIETENLNVDAQTHKNSKMYAKDTAKIKLHRGDLTTKEAHIDILESGKITASQSAHVRQTLGGIIISPVVKIDQMMSNTTVIASELIEIKAISGENNKLIIDPDAIPAYHEQIVVLQEKVKDLKQNLAEQKKLLEEKIKEHQSKIERIKTFQKRVLKATKEGKTPMKQDVIRIKQYKKDSQKFQAQQQELEKSTALDSLEKQLDVLCNKDLHAKIQLKTSYDGHTRVSFISPKTKEELTFIPEGTIPSISLKVDSEGNRSIYKEH